MLPELGHGASPARAVTPPACDTLAPSLLSKKKMPEGQEVVVSVCHTNSLLTYLKAFQTLFELSFMPFYALFRG